MVNRACALDELHIPNNIFRILSSGKNSGPLAFEIKPLGLYLKEISPVVIAVQVIPERKNSLDFVDVISTFQLNQ